MPPSTRERVVADLGVEPDRDIASFDARLDPESKLVLAETAQQLLADADAIHATPMTWAPAKRRYG